MSKNARISHLSDRDWDNLVTVAAGYLPLTNGDIRRAMSRALAAHADLIVAAKLGSISAQVPDGRVTLMVPEEGGLVLRLESNLD